MKLKRKSREDGFSLIEMIIALVCILIFATISTSSYVHFIDGVHVRGAINIVMNIKKAVNDMAVVCNGYPFRTSVLDEYEFLTLIDTLECDPGNPSLTPFPEKYPGDNYCYTAVSIGTMMGVEAAGGVNALCNSVCNYREKGCSPGKHAMTSYFTGITGSNCSPMYGSAPFSGKSPGWNYTILGNPALPRNVPVGVICAVTEGRRPVPFQRQRSPVIITVNTGGIYMGNRVTDGTGIYSIDGGLLPGGGCTCGPFCEEVLSGRSGCCGPCGNEDSLGYKF